MSAYVTPDAVRLAADPEWRAGSAQPDTSGQSAAELSDGQLEDAIREASGRIDTYLGARYAVPIAPLDPDAEKLTYPDPIGTWARDIALYFATLTFLRGAPLEQNDPVSLRYAAAMLDLAATRDGKLTLPLPGAEVSSGSGFAGAVDAGFDGLFDGSDAGYHRGWTSPYAPPWLTGDPVPWQ